METIVRAVAEENRLVLVRTLIEVVPELVMNGREILGRLIDAHFDAHVRGEIDVPRAGVAHDIAVARPDKE